MSRNTNWIYNDYEFENRVNNGLFLVCMMKT